MAIIKKECDYPKELGEVLDLAVEAIKVMREKGDYSSLIDDLVKAAEGAGDIKDEVKNLGAVSVMVAEKVGVIIEIFKEKDEQPIPPAA